MLHALCDAPDAPCPAPFEDAAQPCMLVYTSGTTGIPKGVLLSQTALIYRSTVQARTFATQSHPVVINFAPINHIGGMHFRGLSQILAGGTIIYQERYRPAEVMGLIEKHRVNMLMLGSTMLQMLIREPSFDMSIMRGMEWFIFSGAAIPMPILQRVKEHCPRIGSTYGLTESCGSVSYIVASDSLEAAAYTVGRAIPEGQLRVADEQGQPLPAGTGRAAGARPVLHEWLPARRRRHGRRLHAGRLAQDRRHGPARRRRQLPTGRAHQGNV